VVIGAHGPTALVTMDKRRMIVRADSLLADKSGRTWKVVTLTADGMTLQSSGRPTLHASFGAAP
jgi:hypothetical protein